jgi:ABC-type antimicrobial peptide transport system permease subunit
MKIVGILGILAFLLGGLIFLIGLIVCINTYTSDYASSTCEQAARDREKFSEAKALCGSVTSDCYKQATIGLTSQEDCEYKKEYMQKQMLMGVVPAVIGGIVAFVGLLMAVGGFVIARRKKPAVAS